MNGHHLNYSTFLSVLVRRLKLFACARACIYAKASASRSNLIVSVADSTRLVSRENGPSRFKVRSLAHRSTIHILLTYLLWIDKSACFRCVMLLLSESIRIDDKILYYWGSAVKAGNDSTIRTTDCPPVDFNWEKKRIIKKKQKNFQLSERESRQISRLFNSSFT